MKQLKQELSTAIADFKIDLNNKILEEKEKYLEEKDKEAVSLLDEIARKTNEKTKEFKKETILNENQQIYNPLLGLKIAAEIIQYFNLFLEQDRKIKEVESALEKVRDIKDNFEVFEEIKDNLIEFQTEQQIKDFILNDNRKIIEKRDFLLELLQNLKDAEHIDEKSTSLDNAIKTLINFQNISEMKKNNVFLIKDYINNKFDVNLNMQNLFDIKQVAEHIKSAEERTGFEVNFENITFRNTDYSKMLEEVFKDIEKEAEQEQIKEEEVELER